MRAILRIKLNLTNETSNVFRFYPPVISFTLTLLRKKKKCYIKKNTRVEFPYKKDLIIDQFPSFFFSLTNQHSLKTFIMRTTIAITAAIATLASSALAATNCNPSYNVAESTPCFLACNVVSIS